MKVYRIKSDVAHFQWFLPENETFWAKYPCFNCESVLENWTPPNIYSYNPHKRLGHFPEFSAGVLLIKEEVFKNDLVGMHLEMAGELLPAFHKEGDEKFYLLNVTECLNSLNKSITQWSVVPETGEKLLIQNYSFHINRFSESSIFKIPETCRAEILTYEISGDPEVEFKAAFETSSFEGLIFEELWDSEK